MAIAAVLLATSTRAQLQQPFVYTTGSLTATPASPHQILGFPVVIAAFSILFLALYRDTAGRSHSVRI